MSYNPADRQTDRQTDGRANTNTASDKWASILDPLLERLDHVCIPDGQIDR